MTGAPSRKWSTQETTVSLQTVMFMLGNGSAYIILDIFGTQTLIHFMKLLQHQEAAGRVIPPLRSAAPASKELCLLRNAFTVFIFIRTAEERPMNPPITRFMKEMSGHQGA